MTTAPSQSNNAAVSAAAIGSAASTLPLLKQKTGIIKSKVPPPVPPRGSPKDRRGHHHHHSNRASGSSPKGTTSSGSYNYLNDKYFACTQSTTSRRPSQSQSTNNFDKHRFTILTSADDPVPVFGDRRSPSCVEDWLEINDFNLSPPDQSPKRASVTQTKKPISITTKFLQREYSFRSSAASSSVRSIVKSFSDSLTNEKSSGNKIFPKKVIGKSVDNLVINNKATAKIGKSLDNITTTTNPIIEKNSNQNFNSIKSNFERKSVVYASNDDTHKDEIANLKKYSNVSKLVTAYSGSHHHTPVKPKITSIVKKDLSPIKSEKEISKSVLTNLKPARRKKRQAPRAEDIYCNAKEKQHIISTLSNVDIRSSDENYDTVIDSFSLEGEFV